MGDWRNIVTNTAPTRFHSTILSVTLQARIEDRVTMPQRGNVHDLFFKQSLSEPGVAADFVRQYLPQSVVETLDLESVQLLSGSFVEERLRGSQSDLLFQVGLRVGGIARLYLLLGGRLARWLVQLLFQPPPAEPDVRLSPHPALQ